MKRIYTGLVVIAFVFLISPLAEAETEGRMLVDGWKAYQRMDTGQVQSGDQWNMGFYMGYVTGLIDVSFDVFNIPSGVTGGQIFSVIGKYLDEHPERWHKSAGVLVIEALKEKFPRVPKTKK
jgi:hypothetical protein